ncbi:hypothetical protein LO763_12030 [Glycomyces sp. A-F 0318]|uniref:asparagine synthase-related protein n=1 Tax=Glycomyces amatae TaxID=2881355 RepID=UPI001E3C0341|nr:asparagine synthase-related protein [Glycomyces amatae]MCD0444352.1 hypothetical protein [Glycomyces amatae]
MTPSSPRTRGLRDALSAFGRPSVDAAPAAAESAIPAADDCSHLLYARGFLLAPEPRSLPAPHWRQTRLGRYWFAHDSRTGFALARAGGTWVAVLGRAICLETWTDDIAVIARDLIRAKQTGRTAMLDRIDRLSGRFAIFYEEDGATLAQSDAAGMRAVFYGRRDGCTYVASHAHLVADCVGEAPSSFPDPQTIRKEHNAYSFPGRHTNFARVLALTPNTELVVEKAEPRRFFPREPLAEHTVADAVDEVLPLLQRQLAMLADRDPLIVSLTGGLDSRTTLALTRPLKDRIDYFTYDSRIGEGALREDSEAAEELSRALGFRHHRIPLLYRMPPEPLAGVMDRNSRRVSAPGMPATHLQYDGCRGLHIRSNLYEIGRAFYRAKRAQPEPLTPEHMAFLLTNHKKTPESFAAGFAEFDDATGFSAAAELYDPYDLYYWEHRCGTWLNAHHTEGDVVYDTFTILNSRQVYKALLAVPLEARVAGEAFVEMIRRTWPEALDHPVNGEMIKA